MKKLIIIVLLSGIHSAAQSLMGSVVIEGACLVGRSNQNIGDWPNKIEDKINAHEFGMGLSISGKIKIDSLYQIEIRSGFNMASEFYRSVQLGL